MNIFSLHFGEELAPSGDDNKIEIDWISKHPEKNGHQKHNTDKPLTGVHWTECFEFRFDYLAAAATLKHKFL